MARLKRRDYTPRARGALEGVRVLDLSRLVAGNTLTQVLADFGAEVIKVEPPAGDTLRAWQTNGVPVTWKLYSRSKKSLCLELRRPEAIELLLKLVPSASILIESFRPGILEKMGLAPDKLLERNPKLVVVRISGWGQDGPYSQRPGFGTLIEGMSGFASMNGFADREPVLPPMYLADSVAGLHGAAAAMIALREAGAERRRGTGDRPAAARAAVQHPRPSGGEPASHGQGQGAHRKSLHHHRAAQRLPHQGRTMGVPVGVDPEDDRAPAPRDRPARADRPIRATRPTRRACSTPTSSTRSSAASSARAPRARMSPTSRKHEVTIGPVYDIAQILEDPHVIERELVADYPDADMGDFPMHHVIPRLSRTPGAIRAPAPQPGRAQPRAARPRPASTRRCIRSCSRRAS